MTNQDQVLLAQAAIGKDAEDFFKSDLGRTMVGLARIESRMAMDKLKDPTLVDLVQIQTLRNSIWLGERFEGWLIELMMKGRQSLQQYDVRNSDTFNEGEDPNGQAQADRPEFTNSGTDSDSAG